MFFWERSQCGSIRLPFWPAFLTVPLEIFDDGVFTLASFGAMVQVKAHKAGLRELTSTLRGKHFVVMLLTVSNAASSAFILAI